MTFKYKKNSTCATVDVQYYIVHHLPFTTVSQLLIGSVHYYYEIGEGAEKLKSVKYNSKQPSSAPGRHTAHTHKAPLSNPILKHMD